jgi:hypothetical protein
LADILRLGVAVARQASQVDPAAQNILMITNAGEPAVNNKAIDRLAAAWDRYDGFNVRRYVFQKEMSLPHDLITPGTPGVPIQEVYDRLVAQVQRLHQTEPTQ